MRTTATWLVAAMVVLGFASEASAQRCFVAYVHGHGPNYQGASQQAIENGYWADPSDSGYNTMQSWSSFDYYSGGSRGCTTTLIGYDGTQYFWDAGASVSAQINTFITNNAIGSQSGDQLILVGHSMGGLVLRWIMNNGVPGAPYFNYNGDYQTIVNHTHHFITVASPHSGTETADAIYGQADTWYSNFVGSMLSALSNFIPNIPGPDNGTAAMTRATLQGAGANGGWLGDAYRTRRMYTVAGYTTFDAAGSGESNDGLLGTAFGAICNRPEAINAGLCHEYYGENGDGLVEELSATGRRETYFGSSDPNGGGSGYEFSTSTTNIIAGMRTDWLRIEHNHHQSRYDHHIANIRNCTALNCGDISCETSVHVPNSHCNPYIGSTCGNNSWCQNYSAQWPWETPNGFCSTHNDTGYGTSCNNTPSAVSTSYYPGSYIGQYIRTLAP